MVPALQAKLLRFLEEKTFKRVGGSADIRVDVRVIAATNRKLEDEVQEGPLPRGPVLPPERPADRAAAAARARRRHPAAGQLLRRRLQHGVPQARARRRRRARCSALQAYGWPGNVRELRNAVERAMLLADGDELTRRRLSGGVRRPRARSPSRSSCRRRASISSSSSARWSSRRSSAAAGTRPRRPRCSA